MAEITCKFAETDEEVISVSQIWREVFVDEQHIPEDKVFEDDPGSEAHKIVACADAGIIGAARIVFPEPGIARIERMAVHREYRRTGAGRALVTFIIDFLKNKQVLKIFLHAQNNAVPFYRSCGFSEVGDWFLEVGIRHIQMEMVL